jgi:hypothetical protein
MCSGLIASPKGSQRECCVDMSQCKVLRWSSGLLIKSISKLRCGVLYAFSNFCPHPTMDSAELLKAFATSE